MSDMQVFTEAIQLSAEECANRGQSAPFVALIAICHREALDDLMMLNVPAGQVDILFKQTLMPTYIVVMSWDVYLESDLAHIP